MSTPVPSSLSRRLLIVLAALGVLAVMIVAVVLGKADAPKTEKDAISGGFHELRKDEFSDALLEAREKAGTWSFLEVNTFDGQTRQMIEGKVVWDGADGLRMSYAPQGSAAGEFRLVDGHWYYNNVLENKRKPWVELNKESMATLIAALDKEADPRRQVAIFKNPTGFDVVGVENIGTAVAVHYRVTVPIERVREASGNPVVGDAGSEQVYDVWLDKDDEIVKLVQPTTVGLKESAEVRTFSGYGEKITIDAPPAEQVVQGKVTLG
jgi:hypothetical protein